MLLLWIKVDSFIPIILPNLNPICHLLALGAHHILYVGRIRVNGLRILETMLKTVLNIGNDRMKKVILKGFMIRVCSLFVYVVMVINVCGCYEWEN
jgi:hypothetical protein